MILLLIVVPTSESLNNEHTSSFENHRPSVLERIISNDRPLNSNPTALGSVLPSVLLQNLSIESVHEANRDPRSSLIAVLLEGIVVLVGRVEVELAHAGSTMESPNLDWSANEHR